MTTVEHQPKAQAMLAIQPGLKVSNARPANPVNAAAGIVMAASVVNALMVAMTPAWRCQLLAAARRCQPAPATQRLVSQASSLICCQMSPQASKYGRKQLLN